METVIGLGPQTVIHDQDIRTAETRLVAELGITEWFAAGLVLPLRVFDTRITYRDAAGAPVQIDDPFIHHSNETLVGPGDPWLVGRFARAHAGFAFGARLGIAFPLGRTEEDPFELGDQGLAHEHSQFGTGTVQPLVGLEVARAFGKVRAEAWLLSVQSLYRNGHGYQAGDRYAGGLGVARNLGGKWRLRITGELQAETAERWGGVIHTDEGNTGRVDAIAGIEAIYRLSDTWYLGAQAKLPLYTHVDGGQLDMTGFVGVRLGVRLALFEGDEHHEHGHDHDHDHGDDHHDDGPADWTGLDMRAVDPVADLVPVAGKLTVFDFWATWCKPCLAQLPALEGLARKGDVDVIAINLDDPARAFSMFDTAGYRDMILVADDGEVSQRYNVSTIPHTVIVDAWGMVRSVHRGGHDVAAEVEKIRK